jgi:hypothetical protein
VLLLIENLEMLPKKFCNVKKMSKAIFIAFCKFAEIFDVAKDCQEIFI